MLHCVLCVATDVKEFKILHDSIAFIECCQKLQYHYILLNSTYTMYIRMYIYLSCDLRIYIHTCTMIRNSNDFIICNIGTYKSLSG